MWRRILYVVLLTAACLGVSEAVAKRIVFVAGVDTYDHFGRDLQIRKAVADARAVGAAFKTIGFEVVAAADNPAKTEFMSSWQRFAEKITPGDIAVFYFAGHGLASNGGSFLLMRDTPELVSERFLIREAPNVDGLLKDLRRRGAEAVAAIVDTSRFNPYQPLLGGTQRRVPLALPRGTFLLHSAASGETALDQLAKDDSEPTSLFARELVRLLARRGLALPELAEELQTTVRRLAAGIGHRQSPEFRSALTTTVCLAGCAEVAREIVPVDAPAPAARFENEVLRISPHQSRVVRTGAQASALSLTLRFENTSPSVQGVTSVPRSETPATYRDDQGRDCKLTDIHGLSEIPGNDDAQVLAFDAERAKRSILPKSYVTVIYRFSCPYVHAPEAVGNVRVNLFLVGEGDIRMIEAAISGIPLEVSGN